MVQYDGLLLDLQVGDAADMRRALLNSGRQPIPCRAVIPGQPGHADRKSSHTLLIKARARSSLKDVGFCACGEAVCGFLHETFDVLPEANIRGLSDR